MIALRNQLIAAGAWDAADPRDPAEDIAAAWQLADALGLAVAPITVYEGEGRHGVDPQYRWWAAWPEDGLLASREEIEHESDPYLGEITPNRFGLASTAGRAICLAALQQARAR